MAEEGYVYRGDPKFIHIKDGQRVEIGEDLAVKLNSLMRNHAIENGVEYGAAATKPLCPGCYMVVIFNAAVVTARRNGQTLSELGRTLAAAFQKLADCPPDEYDRCIEEINVLLDAP